MNVRLKTIAALMACLALAVPAFAAPAFGQALGQDPYQLEGAKQQAAVLGVDDDDGDDGGSTPAASGSLPFTGLELGLIVSMGVALLGTGLVVRRVSRGSEG